MNDPTPIYYSSRTEFAWLSNFSPHPIQSVDQRRWPTAEHYFQAAKACSFEESEHVRNAATPTAARRRGRRIRCRSDWNQQRLIVMAEVLMLKFQQHPELQQALLATGNRPLIHEAPWDPFWGNGHDQTGGNWHGRLLMRIRKELQRQRTSPSPQEPTEDTQALLTYLTED